ncbi:MAG: AbrB/MazE/SpoVT family DNA-binding domain-containing protein [Fimbriimonadaceae bacterium]
MESKGKCSIDQLFYGAVTMGERGQIVIPVEARHELEMVAGDKLLIIRHPDGDGLMLFKLEHARQFLKQLEEMIKAVDTAETSRPSEQEDGS